MVTDQFLINLKQAIRRLRKRDDPDDKTVVLYKFGNGAWTIPGFPIGESYAPLGVEGGIARSTRIKTGMSGSSSRATCTSRLEGNGSCSMGL